MKIHILSALAAALTVALCSIHGLASESDFQRWKQFVDAGESEQATALVSELRQRGPEVIDELMATRHRNGGEWDQFIDAVGGQRYCGTSRLFWHTDLDEARHAAAESGKPILSLRMLGNLTDELSCANSRFFRTTLYANAGISDILREHFVLHWESVRPAPVMTIDFGDGRRMIRTVTGNSIHYVMDSEGRPLDGLPGLYGPQAFQEWLERAAALGVAINQAVSPDERTLILNGYHEGRLREIRRQWQQDLVTLELTPEATPAEAVRAAVAERDAVPAEEAVVRAIPKMRVEALPIAMITMSEMRELTTDSVWRDIALLHAEESQLDDASRALIFSEIPEALRSDLVAVTKSGVERRALTRMFSSLQTLTALDTVRNEYELHLRIHEWFILGEVGDDVDPLNQRVYAELFLTPDTDPWLGLFDPTVYTGLANAGIVDVTE